VGFTAGKRYPLLTYAHGGPSGRFGMSFTPQLDAPYPAQSEQYPVQAFAGQGYAVLLPNPRGSNGYGEQFRMANVKDWGHGDYDDIMSGIDSLIGQGIADADRLGIMGWSYGGFMTSWIITQTDRFRAASLGAAMTNLESFYGQTDIPDYMEYFFGDVPWKAKSQYERSSPMSFVANVKTPTLIQHGERDQRVPLSQTQELYAALKKKKVPVEYAVYPRQGHVVMEPKLQADVLRRNLEWFNRWLGAASVSKAEAQAVK
jgi:dipeptidyl aminopeptidase/acylaminoacyl peptidase